MFTVLVRFCGGCNPEIDRGETVKQVMDMLAGKVRFTTDRTQPADLTLRVSGCAHACIDEEAHAEYPMPAVSVQGRRIEREPVEASRLAETIAAKICSLSGVSGVKP